jgi:hypothetical protein
MKSVATAAAVVGLQTSIPTLSTFATQEVAYTLCNQANTVQSHGAAQSLCTEIAFCLSESLKTMPIIACEDAERLDAGCYHLMSSYHFPSDRTPIHNE